MQITQDIARRVSRTERLVGCKMGLRHAPLAQQAKRLRRELPVSVHRDMMLLAQSQHLSGHPRIARQIDPRAVAQAEKRTRRFLMGPALHAQRLTRRLRWRGGLVLNLMLFAAGLVCVLLWRGLI